MQCRIPLLLLLGSALVGLAGCAGGCNGVNPVGPAPLPPVTPFSEAVLSTVSIPIEIPAVEIDSLVNLAIPQELYSVQDKKVGSGLKSTRLDLDIRRNGPVYSSSRDGLLFTHLPLHAEGRVRVPPGVRRGFTTTFTVHITSEVSLDSTWATVAHTQGTFTWEETPYIRLLGIRIGLRGTAENALEKQLEKLVPRIDQIIEDRVNIRGRVERLWEDLETPFALREEPPVWLQVKPMATYFSPSTSRNDTLLFGLRMHAYLETLVGEEPQPTPLGALPPLTLLPDTIAVDSIPKFHINLPVSVTYDDAKALLTEALTDKNYEVQNHIAFTVKEIDLYGHADTLVARVDFSASVPNTPLTTQGRVFFTGTPRYDAESQTVRIDRFDYDVHSRDALANVADWLLKEDFLEATRQRLLFPLGPNISALQSVLEEALQDRPVGKYIILNGVVTDIVPSTLSLAPDGIQVNLTAQGHLTAQIQSLATLKRRHPR